MKKRSAGRDHHQSRGGHSAFARKFESAIHRTEGHPKPLEQLQALTFTARAYFWPTPQTEEQREFILRWMPGPCFRQS
jgi:hypothetical protein